MLWLSLSIARIEAIRIFIANAATRICITKWMVKTDFLNGDLLEEVLSVSLKDLKPNISYALYDLKKRSIWAKARHLRAWWDEDLMGVPDDQTRSEDMVLEGTLNHGSLVSKDNAMSLKLNICRCGSGGMSRFRRSPSVSKSAQFLRDRLVSWSSKKQRSTTISTTEAEYIAMSGCCAQILWMRSQLKDYWTTLAKTIDIRHQFHPESMWKKTVWLNSTSWKRIIRIRWQNTLYVPCYQPPTRTDMSRSCTRLSVVNIGEKQPEHFNAHKIQRTPIFLISVEIPRKTSGSDKPRHPVLQMLWGIVTPSKLINNNIHRRPESAVHHTGDDFILGNLKFVPKGESVEVFGMAIPAPGY
ncbi:hypothetical protein Tco_0550512 [Tanacetum coccineum]